MIRETKAQALVKTGLTWIVLVVALAALLVTVLWSFKVSGFQVSDLMTQDAQRSDSREASQTGLSRNNLSDERGNRTQSVSQAPVEPVVDSDNRTLAEIADDADPVPQLKAGEEPPFEEAPLKSSAAPVDVPALPVVEMTDTEQSPDSELTVEKSASGGNSSDVEDALVAQALLAIDQMESNATGTGEAANPAVEQTAEQAAEQTAEQTIDQSADQAIDSDSPLVDSPIVESEPDQLPEPDIATESDTRAGSVNIASSDDSGNEITVNQPADNADGLLTDASSSPSQDTNVPATDTTGDLTSNTDEPGDQVQTQTAEVLSLQVDDEESIAGELVSLDELIPPDAEETTSGLAVESGDRSRTEPNAPLINQQESAGNQTIDADAPGLTTTAATEASDTGTVKEEGSVSVSEDNFVATDEILDRAGSNDDEAERFTDGSDAVLVSDLVGDDVDSDQLAGNTDSVQVALLQNVTVSEAALLEVPDTDDGVVDVSLAEQTAALPQAVSVVEPISPDRQLVYRQRRDEELAILRGQSARIRFNPGSAEVTRELETPLDRIFDALFLYAEMQVDVTVAVNEFSGTEDNDDLSLNRGNSVVEYLVNRGLDEQRFSVVVNSGEQLPVGTHRVTITTRESGQ